MVIRRATGEASTWLKSAILPPSAILFTVGTCAGLLVVGAFMLFALRRNTRKLKMELAEQRTRADAAQAGNQAKAEFLTSMSHQIRTPLNGIMGFTGLALKSDLNPELREYLDTVRISADWLMRVANDVLEFSGAASGALQIESRPFSISECAHSALKLVEREAGTKKLLLKCRVDSGIPDLVRGDPVRLRYVIFNLLDHAVKFTNCGSILLLVALEEETDESLMIRVAVNDTGTGFTAALRSSIVEPYQPIDASTPPERRGSGFGLAIAKQIVGLMGGSMNLQSQLGAGTCFEFTARVGKEAAIAGQTPAQVISADTIRANDLKVLLVDDNVVDRKLISTILKSAGCRVECASNGEAAVKMAQSEPFDIVLMDIEMDGLDGVQATRAIRASEQPPHHLPIYALSAHVSSEDRARCLDAGMDEFISKPIALDDLLQRLSNVNPRVTSAGTHEPTMSLEPKTSLEPAISLEPTISLERKASLEPATSLEPTTSVEPTASLESTASFEPTTSIEPAISIASHEPPAISVSAEDTASMPHAVSEEGPRVDAVDSSATDLSFADIELAEEKLPNTADEAETSGANDFVIPALDSATSLLDIEECESGRESSRNAKDLDAISRALYREGASSGSFALRVKPLCEEPDSAAVLDRFESAVPSVSDELILAVVEQPAVSLSSHTDLRTEEVDVRPIALVPSATPVALPSTTAVASFPAESRTDSRPTPAGGWDPFEQARTALFRSRFDVRVVHQDGDPSNLNLI